MDFKLISSIYRKPWLIESNSALAFLQLLEEIKQDGKKFTYGDEDPGNRIKLFANFKNVITAPIDTWGAEEHPGYEGATVAVLPVIGPLMKEDFCGWFGTQSLRRELAKMKAAKSVKEIVMLSDSPGGTVDGTEAFADDYRDAGKTKGTTTIIEGMMCSAGYWIGSSGKRVIAANHTDIIGSIGTMIAFYDRSQYMEEMGIILREYYADDSKDKNRDIREAKQGKGRLLIESILNPLNDVFLDAVRTNRGDKLDEKRTLTGKTFISEEAKSLGLVDEVSNVESVVEQLLHKHKNQIFISMKFPTLRKIFGLSDKDKVELTEQQLDQLEQTAANNETLTAENEKLKGEVTELKTATTASATKITELESQVQTLSIEKANQATEITGLKAEVEKLGKMDGAKFTETEAQKEKQAEEAQDNPMNMSFQKELMEKAV